MAKTNKPIVYPKVKTHEGAPAVRVGVELELRRTLLACMLWEKGFYESGQEVAQRLKTLIPQVKADKVAQLAIDARNKYKLRHATLFVVREMARLDSHKGYVREILPQVVQRADELAEFMALYQDGKTKQPISAQVKKGLAAAFGNFSEYQFAKYNRDGAWKLRDVMFMVHPNPEKHSRDDATGLYKRIAENSLETPDTWEVSLSRGDNKKETWERLINENKLGGLALLRNLRNMQQVGVNEDLIFKALEDMSVERILPFRFVAAARYAPQWESRLEPAMYKAIEGRAKLSGKTILLVDVSGSMDSQISDKSEMQRLDAACGLAILAREQCEKVAVYTFSGNTVQVPDRRGFALRDAIVRSQVHGGTYLGAALNSVNSEKYDRIIIFTDEQSHDSVGAPKGKGYMVNVATNRYGVGYGSWVHIDGFSEAIFDYIVETESAN